MKRLVNEIDFSVVIPSYRDARILGTIDSINHQNYPRDRIEIVVIDGGSEVRLLDAIRSQLSSHDVLVSGKDEGIFDAINKGIQRASGSVLFTLGSDDKLASANSVGAFMACFRDPAVQYVCARILYTDKSWKPIRDWPGNLPTLTTFLLGRQVSHFGFACRSHVYQEVGQFHLKYDVSADFDFFLRLSKRKLVGATLDECVALMRIGGNSSKNVGKVARGNWQIVSSGLSHYGLLVLFHLAAKPLVKGMQFLRVFSSRCGSKALPPRVSTIPEYLLPPRQ